MFSFVFFLSSFLVLSLSFPSFCLYLISIYLAFIFALLLFIYLFVIFSFFFLHLFSMNLSFFIFLSFPFILPYFLFSFPLSSSFSSLLSFYFYFFIWLPFLHNFIRNPFPVLFILFFPIFFYHHPCFSSQFTIFLQILFLVFSSF